MSDEIVIIAPKTIEETRSLSKELALSNLMPAALRKKPEDLFAIVLTGAELGLAPMQAVRGMHIIEGKVSLSADLMGALVKRSPVCEYLTLVESSGTVATYRTKRKSEPGETVISFTIEQAHAAGVAGKGNWAKYPDAMLRARALSAICRAVYPDLCLGLYDSESGELGEVRAPISDQAAHVQSVKDAIRAQVTEVRAPAAVSSAVERFATAVGPAVTDAEFTEESWEDKINGAASADALKAMLPALQALPPERAAVLKPLFNSRRAVLVINAP